jgi:YjbE family integral membrane protein
VLAHALEKMRGDCDVVMEDAMVLSVQACILTGPFERTFQVSKLRASGIMASACTGEKRGGWANSIEDGGVFMEFMAEIQTAVFWTGLLSIILVNIVLSGDNAVVIALAARSLPKHQQGKAIAWGAGAAVALRIVLTIVAVEALKYPFLKIIGALLLFWIAVKLLIPEDGEENIESSDNLIQAIKTILVADLVMSMDNVIGVAAAAKGSMTLLILGLAISIPLVIFGATILLKLMDRFPIIITIGAGLLGWVSGEMLVTDPYVINWIAANVTWLEIELPFGWQVNWAQILGAAFVIGAGKWFASRAHEDEVKSG